MQNEYGICQQMTYSFQSYMCVSPADELCCPGRVKLLQLVSIHCAWCVCACVCTYMACVCVHNMHVRVLCACFANAYELYIHIQMLPSSSKALITNSQCLR